jgi:hypothetical protein
VVAVGLATAEDRQTHGLGRRVAEDGQPVLHRLTGGVEQAELARTVRISA